MDSVSESWSALVDHKLFVDLAVLVGTVVVALLIRLVLMPLLHHLVGRTSSTLDNEILDRLSPVLTQTILLVGLYWIAAHLLPENRWDRLVASFLATLLVLIWGRFALMVGALVFDRFSRQPDRFLWVQPTSLPVIKFAFKLAVFGLVAYLLLSVWRMNLTSWLASAGVAGIALGFAAKDTLSNFISGMVILMDAPYKVGDYIIIEGATRGEVTEIGMRSTRILTRDNVEVTVPNGVIGNAMIVNETSGPTSTMRIRVDVGVAYGSDVEKVREVLLGCTRDLPRVDAVREAVVRFAAMGESSLDFQVMVWVTEPQFRGTVINELNTRIYQGLDAAGIEIPFPQRDLHVKGWPGGDPTPPAAGNSVDR